MAVAKKRIDFFQTEEGYEFEQALKNMLADKAFNTESSYSTNSMAYPDNQMPFIEKHKAFINSHPAVNPKSYLANLRLMTRHRK